MYYYFGKYNIDIQILGKKNNFKFLPYEEAKKFVQTLKLKSYQEWLDYTNNELSGYDKKPNEIHDYPYLIYKNEWIGDGDWLGIEYLDDFIASFRELYGEYLDGYQKKTSMYQYKISEEQINDYLTLFHKIDDDNIHKMIANLNYVQLEPEIINKIFHVQNKYTEFIGTLLANPTISLEIKIKHILMDEGNADKEIVLNLISHLDTNVDEEEQVKKLINAFEQTSDSLPYTPNFTNLENSNIITNKLVEQLKEIEKKLPEKKKKIIAQEKAYVGSDTCKMCHLEHYDSWKMTMHSRMTQDAEKNRDAIITTIDEKRIREDLAKLGDKLKVPADKIWIPKI